MTLSKIGCLLAAICILASSTASVSAQQIKPQGAHALYGNTTGPSSKFKSNVLHLKIRSDNGLHLEKGVFVGGNTAETARLNSMLAGAKKVRTEKLAGGTSSTAAAVKDYYKVTFAKDVDIVSLAGQLETLQDTIVFAYPEAKPAPVPSAPLYTSLQNYLRPAADGINADFARTYPGGLGDKSRIIDIEYSWNTAHTDLPSAASAMLPNGTPVDPFSENSHGTAVLGEMIGANNKYGVTGISPSSALTLINANSAENGYDVTGALVKASTVAKPGDVVIIEQQTWGVTDTPYNYLPIEWIPEAYDAIRSLTASGVIVVEPAANGGQSLDNLENKGQAFPMGKPDSGAIMVGAGQNCSWSTERRSRTSTSNYGLRVNLQGPGECVASTGYGDVYSAGGVNEYYTQNFNGTSSASPVVAGAAAVLNSAYKSLNGGSVLTPLQVRSILQSTGTAQATGSYPGNIGPMPDLGKALYKADLTAPTSPTLSGVVTSTHYASLSWTAANDNVGVASYQIYRNGVFYKTVTTRTYVDKAVTKGKTYTYRVRAIDYAGRAGLLSTSISLTIR